MPDREEFGFLSNSFLVKKGKYGVSVVGRRAQLQMPKMIGAERVIDEERDSNSEAAEDDPNQETVAFLRSHIVSAVMCCSAHMIYLL